MATSSPPPCSLLDLPPEVRNNIYENVLSTDRTLRPNVAQLFRLASIKERNRERLIIYPAPKVLALALACRQIHNEVLRFYYGRNTFWFINTYDLYRFLYMIGEQRRNCITSIEVLWVGERRSEAAKMLGECLNLQRLYIGVNWGTTHYTPNPQQNLWLSRGVGQLRKLRVPGLDLRIREPFLWARMCQVLYFEMSIKELAEYHESQSMLYRTKFRPDHVEEFERDLREEINMPRKDGEPEQDAVVGDAFQIIIPTRKKRELKGRDLTSGKVAVQQQMPMKMRKLQARKARETGELKRRAPGPRLR